jgi:hypothetical protein
VSGPITASDATHTAATCTDVEAAGFLPNDNVSINNNFGDPSQSSGVANSLMQCIEDQGCTACQ